MSAPIPYPAGTAPIKAEYLLTTPEDLLPQIDDASAEEGTNHAAQKRKQEDNSKCDFPPKKPKLSAAERRKLTKEEKKAQRGSNKGRRWAKMRDEVDLCWRFAGTGNCDFGSECRLSHDIPAYLEAKPRDIFFPSGSMLRSEPPFVSLPPSAAKGGSEELGESEPSVDPPSIRCPVFEATGSCRIGLKCRFLGGHVRKAEDGTVSLVEDEERKRVALAANTELNLAKKCPTPISDVYLQELKAAAEDQDGKEGDHDVSMPVETEGAPPLRVLVNHSSEPIRPQPMPSAPSGVAADPTPPNGPQMKFSEKRRLHWSDKTCTRLCVSLGATLRAGKVISGPVGVLPFGVERRVVLGQTTSVRTMFGVQVAGNKPGMLVPTAEVIARECGSGGIDFMDLNCGCPIDLVFRTGSGSALLDAAGKLGKILIGMNKALGEIPLTIKMRTGVREGRNTTHKLMPRISAEWNVAAMTLHGRTRQQRYTKLADWDYIENVSMPFAHANPTKTVLPRIPIFGGGDAFSAQDYWSKVESSGVDGVMIARGALIKPWIFTEIKERREWDISSGERLEFIRKYAEFGLDHFGTDTVGVNTTRRYLCEALSFQYRYVPVGLLEHLPPRINDRAPLFRGRDELETLLASGDSRDWVKISEMFLGPAPESWTFTPKHKSNAHGGEEGQG
ncbi:hypothetical protein BC826DRAFT_988480 [Russula brevipes]|nr:hypothetical protein BC826DRAFT_988480 [Russula brevipes]